MGDIGVIPGNDLSVSITEALTAVCQQARQSLVVVHNGRRGAGAGIVWRPGGIIVTNYHVIHRGQPRISLLDGGELPTRIIARAKEIDLAILKVDESEIHDSALTVAPVADSSSLRVGQFVLAIGHPWGQIGSVSAGIISSLGRVPLRRKRGSVDVLRTDIGLAPGNSGGPLLNASGGVIGINTMIIGGDLGVAIPSHVVDSLIEETLGQEIFQVAI
jgi:serine protease Do